MSIREVGEKIKALVRVDAVFYGVVGVLIAVIFFSLGRLTVTTEKRAIVQKSEAQPSIALTASAIASGATGTPFRAPAATATPEGGKAYVGSRKGNRYHLPWCSGARRISEENKVWFASKEEAEKAGYTPAANCPGI